jgi:hypothetical protein
MEQRQAQKTLHVSINTAWRDFEDRLADLALSTLLAVELGVRPLFGECVESGSEDLVFARRLG